MLKQRLTRTDEGPFISRRLDRLCRVERPISMVPQGHHVSRSRRWWCAASADGSVPVATRRCCRMSSWEIESETSACNVKASFHSDSRHCRLLRIDHASCMTLPLCLVCLIYRTARSPSTDDKRSALPHRYERDVSNEGRTVRPRSGWHRKRQHSFVLTGLNENELQP